MSWLVAASSGRASFAHAVSRGWRNALMGGGGVSVAPVSTTTVSWSSSGQQPQPLLPQRIHLFSSSSSSSTTKGPFEPNKPPPSPPSSSSPFISFARPPPAMDVPTNGRRAWRTHNVSLKIGYYPPMETDNSNNNRRGNNYNNNNNTRSGGGGYDNRFAATTTNNTTMEAPTPPPTKNWRDEERELAEQVKAIQDERDAKQKRWVETAKPPIRQSIIDERGRAYGRGGRKTAAARVWIQPGVGLVVVNRKDFCDYFDRSTDRQLVLAPLAATATCGKFDVTATVTGGGLTGQAGAIGHGLARALNHYNPDVYRPPLKRLGYLTRDPRKVERKKVGHLKARKKPQWVKR